MEKAVNNKNHRLAMMLVLFAAITLRLLHFASSSENPILYMHVLDERYYLDLGKGIASGHWLGEDGVFFMDPFYGYFLAFIFYFFGDNLTTVRIIQIVLDSFNVVFVYAIGSRIWNKFAGISGALVYAFYPVAFFYTLLILKTTLATTLLLCFILLLLIALDNGRKIHWYGLGLLSAIMIYLRANFILLVPFTVLFCVFFEKSRWRAVIGHVMLLFAGLATLVSIGVFRNYLVSNEIVLFNSQAGRLLYSCNNSGNLTGRYNLPSFARAHPVSSEKDFQEETELRVGAQLNASEISRYWVAETLRLLWQNPKIIPVLLFNKLKGTLSNCEIPNNHSYYLASRFSPLLKWPFPSFALALAFGLPGLVLGIQRERKAAILLIPLLTVLITIIVFYTSSRFRMPAVPFLLIGSGICLSILYYWIKKSETIKAGMLLSCVGIIGFLSLLVPCPKGSGTEEFFLAKAYWRQNDYENAEYFAFKGKTDFPSQARFHVLLGMISSSNNRPDQAIQHNRTAINLDPDNMDAFHNMGLVYLHLKKPDEAIRYFVQAINIEPRPNTFFWLAKAHEEAGCFSLSIKNYSKFLETSKISNPLREEAVNCIEGLDR
jgi:tetratricopeptide (TPR) repeat protein